MKVYKCDRCGAEVGLHDRTMQKDWYEIRTIELPTAWAQDQQETRDLTVHFCCDCYKVLVEWFVSQAHRAEMASGCGR